MPPRGVEAERLSRLSALRGFGRDGKSGGRSRLPTCHARDNGSVAGPPQIYPEATRLVAEQNKNLATIRRSAYPFAMASEPKKQGKTPIPALALANLFVTWGQQGGHGVTPLKLQKLLYFCHAEYLVYREEALIDEEFEAWTYGPVVPSVYQAFKDYSNREIDSPASQFDPLTCGSSVPEADIDETTAAWLRDVYRIYAPVSGGQLSDLSHTPGGPWDVAMQRYQSEGNLGRRIPNALIRLLHGVRTH